MGFLVLETGIFPPSHPQPLTIDTILFLIIVGMEKRETKHENGTILGKEL